MAASGGWHACVQALLEEGADRNLRTPPPSSKTALDYAKLRMNDASSDEQESYKRVVAMLSGSPSAPSDKLPANTKLETAVPFPKSAQATATLFGQPAITPGFNFGKPAETPFGAPLAAAPATTCSAGFKPSYQAAVASIPATKTTMSAVTVSAEPVAAPVRTAPVPSDVVSPSMLADAIAESLTTQLSSGGPFEKIMQRLLSSEAESMRAATAEQIASLRENHGHEAKCLSEVASQLGQHAKLTEDVVARLLSVSQQLSDNTADSVTSVASLETALERAASREAQAARKEAALLAREAQLKETLASERDRNAQDKEVLTQQLEDSRQEAAELRRLLKDKELREAKLESILKDKGLREVKLERMLVELEREKRRTTTEDGDDSANPDGDLHSSASVRTPVPASIERVFRHIDANSDGQITRAELIRACRESEQVCKALGLPQHVRQEDTSDDAFESLFQQIDFDDSKGISLDELYRHFIETDSDPGTLRSPSMLANCRRLEASADDADVSSIGGMEDATHTSKAQWADAVALFPRAKTPSSHQVRGGTSPAVDVLDRLSTRTPFSMAPGNPASTPRRSFFSFRSGAH